MAFFIGRDREARRAYGFDEVAIATGLVTLPPEETDVRVRLGSVELQFPILASAMDGVVDVPFAVSMSRLGALAVLNLDGVQTRYSNPQEVLDQIVRAAPGEATELVQKIYQEPVQERLVGERIAQIKKAGGLAAVSTIPQNAARLGPLAEAAGADILFIQATVVTARHESRSASALDLKAFCRRMKIPVVIGNTVTYDAALELMETGCVAVLVGVGPGAACTSRGVLGIGVPQVTATADCAAARDFYFKKTGRYVSVVTDGGMATGGEVCKAFASGADCVMIGSALARASEAPGRGFHWGMATPHRYLPRGTRIQVGTSGTLEEILFGPARTDDGTQNLVGAIRTCMGLVGACNLKELQLAELLIAPEIQHEGKLFQKAQKIGMGK
ncbi:MAG: GuaB3 family IMP dehydrogenase-related protein [Elusimicrobia bacterium]|nr:GuaB3 family IMP dehydrogenase-related protein [Elusimicrobiota bacterium]